MMNSNNKIDKVFNIIIEGTIYKNGSRKLQIDVKGFTKENLLSVLLLIIDDIKTSNKEFTIVN